MQSANEKVYDIVNLSCEMGGQKILDGVSFSISQGEFVAVIGPNGAGKSTLLKHLVGVKKPPPGTVRLFGREINDIKQREIALKVGYVPQSSPVYLPFTVLQFVMMGRYPHMNPLLRPGREHIDTSMEYINKVGMTDFAGRRMDMLSGGERQKIFIASALAQEPEIILLDEPTTYLDPRHQCDVQSILAHQNSGNGLCVLAVTHDINFASRFAGRVIALKKGKLVFDGTPEKIMNKETLEGLFDTNFDIIESGIDGAACAFPNRNI